MIRVQKLATRNVIIKLLNYISYDYPTLLRNWKLTKESGQHRLETFGPKLKFAMGRPNEVLAIGPSLQCRNLQSCQRLELRAVACNVKVKGNIKR